MSSSFRVTLFFAAILVGGCSAAGDPWCVVDEPLLVEYAEGKQPAVVVDLDDTLVSGGLWKSLRLFLGLDYKGVDPFPGAPQALRELRKHWDVVLLTARDDSVAERTREWLTAHEFPRLPVIFSSRWLLGAGAREEFKHQAIERLKARGLRVAVGIGDKADDLLAYERCNLATILVLESPQDPDLPRTLEALHLTSWESLSGLQTPPKEGERPGGPWIAFFSHRHCWPEIERRLLLAPRRLESVSP